MSAITSTIEDAIHDWVVAGSQLVATQVVWAGERPLQPEGCYIAMRLSAEREFGDDWHDVEDSAEDSDPDGDLAYTSYGVRLVTLTLECFAAGETWAAAQPERRLARVLNARRLPTIRESMRAANVGVGPVTEVQALQLDRSTIFEPRARVEITLHVNMAITELLSWIKTMEITPTITNVEDEFELPMVVVERPDT